MYRLQKVLASGLFGRKLFHWSREFVFFIHEQALRLPVGGPEVMKDQQALNAEQSNELITSILF